MVAFDEDDVKRLIDRLKVGGKVTPPPLWDAVERYPLALAASFADRDWLTVPDELPANRPGLVPFARLVRAAGGLAMGAVSERGDVRLTAVVTADDLPGVADPLRAAAARTGSRPWVRVAGRRATASVLVSMTDVMAVAAGGAGDD